MGAGEVARHFARSVMMLPDHKVHHVASRTAARAQGLVDTLGVSARISDSYDALCADPQVDAIYVATPAAAHLENVRMALKAGKPVLCEKPFTVTADEARQLAALARDQGVFCMEAMWMRFIPAIQDLKFRIDAGEIGAVKLLQAELGFAQPFDAAGRHFDPAQGGGALLDLGVYPLSLAWFLLGRPYQGQALTTPAPSGVDAQTAVTLAFEGGALATLTCSFTQRLRNQALVAGETGTILTADPLFSPDALIQTRAPLQGPVQSSTPRGSGRLAHIVEKYPFLVQLRRRYAPLLRQLVRRERRRHNHPFPGFGYQFEAQEVARCVRAGLTESPVMPLSETIDIFDAMDALRTDGRFDWRDRP